MVLYKHGVEISEAATSVQPAVATPSCLPILFCISPDCQVLCSPGQITTTAKLIVDANGNNIPYDDNATFELHPETGSKYSVDFVNISGNLGVKASTGTVTAAANSRLIKKVEGFCLLNNFSEFKKKFMYDKKVNGGQYEQGTDKAMNEDTWCIRWAEQWFLNARGGAAFICVTSSGYSLEDAFEDVKSLKERFGVKPTLVCIGGACQSDGLVSWGASDISILSVINAAESIRALAVVCLQSEDAGDTTYTGTRDKNCVLVWPESATDGVTNYPTDAVLCGTMSRVDAANGGYPFASPSNNVARINGVMYASGGDTSDMRPAYLTQEIANDNFNRKGIVTFWNNVKGWCVWGNNTSAYPGTTDIKDRFIPTRRMFNYVENDFEDFAIRRVDFPLQKRQIQGIIDSYNMRLAGFIGNSALNAARIELDEAANTTESFLNGEVHFRLYIAPPPPMEDIAAVVEYDVEGFTASLA